MEITVRREGSVLVCNPDEVASLPSGKFLKVKITVPRNVQFHRKFFAMLDVGFDAWEPPGQEYKGLPVQKNRSRFRKDCIIAAGFFEPVADLNGNVKAQADSMSFGNCSEDKFAEIYSAVADVLLQRILRNSTRADLDEQVDRIVGFL